VIAQSETVLIRPTAHGQTRGIAMVQGAVYDAVNALDADHQPYVLNLAALRAQPFGSRDAAIATAAHHVLVAIVEPARVGGLDASYATTLAAIPPGPTKDEGVRVGTAAAAAMLDARADDGYLAPFAFDMPFPDHPSGHGCISGAVLRTFREFFSTDKVGFDVHSGRFPGHPRHFDRFSHALKEIVDARVWGGIHFRTADVQGAVMGKKVGHWLQKHFFRRAR
jgi:hypothetical protein